MEYFEKIGSRPGEDLAWNIPEQRYGTVNIVGGNSQSFRTEIKTAEFLAGKYPLANVNVLLPDVLKPKLPPLDNLVFLPSTGTGSINESEELSTAFSAADFNLVLGDFSKNSVTKMAIESACENAEKPLLITRDAVDLVAEANPGKLLTNKNVLIFGSLVQMQKMLRAVYYPKMLLLSQSLLQVVEILHKFTLSYPISLATLHSGQILLAEGGLVRAIPLEKSGFSAFLIWGGELAAKITAFNLYNPNNFLNATVAAIFAE